MLKLESGWQIQVDLSPEWLFFRIEQAGADSEQPSVSEQIWSYAGEHEIKRFVCEIDDSVLVNSYLIGQLIILHKRSHLEDGTLRICGLSENNNRVIDLMQLNDRFPNYASRRDAVMGWHPQKPR